MTETAWLILLHQLLFQSMFVAKNLVLARKLGQPIRGGNREASLSILFFAVFIGLSVVAALLDEAPGQFALLPWSITLAAGLALMMTNLVVGLASLRDLGESWRVGVIEEQQTALVEDGIYRYSRNPYFVSYLLMFAAYTVLLQNAILLLLSLVGFGMIHAMIRKEESYLAQTHGEAYTQYKHRVPRYLLVW